MKFLKVVLLGLILSVGVSSFASEESETAPLGRSTKSGLFEVPSSKSSSEILSLLKTQVEQNLTYRLALFDLSVAEMEKHLASLEAKIREVIFSEVAVLEKEKKDPSTVRKHRARVFKLLNLLFLIRVNYWMDHTVDLKVAKEKYLKTTLHEVFVPFESSNYKMTVKPRYISGWDLEKDNGFFNGPFSGAQDNFGKLVSHGQYDGMRFVLDPEKVPEGLLEPERAVL